MINSEFKELIDSIFDRWTCKKRRINTHLAEIYTEDRHETHQDHIKCCKAIHPITKEERFVGVRRSIFGTNDLASNGFDFEDPRNLFWTIVDEVIRRQFKLTSKGIEDGYLYTMKRGRQFNTMLEDARPELIASSDYNKENPWYDNEDDYFKGGIMDYEFDYVYDKEKDIHRKVYKDPEYDGDKIEEELIYEYFSDIDIYSPFKSRIGAIKEYLWKSFQPRMISYIDLDFAIDLNILAKNHISIYGLKRDQASKIILDYCPTKEKIISILDIAIKHYKIIYKNKRDPELNENLREFELVRSEESFDYMKRYIERYMSDQYLHTLVQVVEDLKEFDEPCQN